MKRAIALLLASMMLLALAGCGVSQEVKAVQDQITAIGEVTAESAEAVTAAAEAYKALPAEEQEKVKNAADLAAAQESLATALIDAIGEVTAESEEAVTAAEAAYEALPEASRANIANADVLSAAREALDKALVEKELREALAGEWIELGNLGHYSYNSDDPVLTLDENSHIEVLEGDPTGKARISANGRTVDMDRTGAYPTLMVDYFGGDDPSTNTDMLMRAEDFAAWSEENVTAVEITADNLAEYIGEQTHLADDLDEWGADTGMDVYYLASAAYEKGLVFIGCSEDFDIRIVDEWGDNADYVMEGKSPYTPYYPNTINGRAMAVDVVDGRGTLYYIPAEKVADVSYEEHERSGDTYIEVYRVVTTTDGHRFIDRCDWGTGNRSYYGYLADADVKF